jgi:hypothetical protein
MMNRGDSMVLGKSRDDNSSGFLMGLPLAGDFESMSRAGERVTGEDVICKHA